MRTVRFLFYLDQNIVSDARKTEVPAVSFLLKEGGLPCVSDVNEWESRRSGRPHEFRKALIRLGAAEIDRAAPYCSDSDPTPYLSLVENSDFLQDQAISFEDVLFDISAIMQMMQGGLRNSSLREEIELLSSNMTDVIGKSFSEFGRGIKELALAHYTNQIRSIFDSIESSETIRDDISRSSYRLGQRRERYAETCHLPPLDAARVLLALAEEEEPGSIGMYREGFAASAQTKETANIAGFGYLLWSLGLCGEKGEFNKAAEKQRSAYRSAFYDALHIERAASTSLFLTKDKNAGRLAEAVYLYSGLPTQSVVV